MLFDINGKFDFIAEFIVKRYVGDEECDEEIEIYDKGITTMTSLDSCEWYGECLDNISEDEFNEMFKEALEKLVEHNKEQDGSFKISLNPKIEYPIDIKYYRLVYACTYSSYEYHSYDGTEYDDDLDFELMSIFEFDKKDCEYYNNPEIYNEEEMIVFENDINCKI